MPRPVTSLATPLAASSSAALGWVALLGLLGCAEGPSEPPNVVLAVLAGRDVLTEPLLPGLQIPMHELFAGDATGDPIRLDF